jgi:hypothetical protein
MHTNPAPYCFYGDNIDTDSLLINFEAYINLTGSAESSSKVHIHIFGLCTNWPNCCSVLFQGLYYIVRGPFKCTIFVLLDDSCNSWQMMEWWYQSAEERMSAPTVYPPPPPPPPPKVIHSLCFLTLRLKTVKCDDINW